MFRSTYGSCGANHPSAGRAARCQDCTAPSQLELWAANLNDKTTILNAQTDAVLNAMTPEQYAAYQSRVLKAKRVGLCILACLLSVAIIVIIVN